VLGVLLFRTAVLDGHTVLALAYAAATLHVGWLLIRRHWRKRHPPGWTKVMNTASRWITGVSTFAFGTAVLATISAVRTSGDDRILWAVGAGVLSVCGAVTVANTVALHRYRSGRPLGRLSWTVRRSSFQRGCAYCADDSNMSAENLEHLAGDEDRQMVLVRCPRCDWLYVIPLHPPSEVIHITESQAGVWFPA
jgi:hypothetical protein